MAGIIVYIKNAPLIIEVLKLQRLISRGGGQHAITLLNNTPLGGEKLPALRDIDKCVNLGLRAGASFGLLNSCLTRSAIRCVLYRRKGIDAKVAFGLGRKGELLDGHCWLIEPGTAQTPALAGQTAYSDILIFPISPD